MGSKVSCYLQINDKVSKERLNVDYVLVCLREVKFLFSDLIVESYVFEGVNRTVRLYLVCFFVAFEVCDVDAFYYFVLFRLLIWLRRLKYSRHSFDFYFNDTDKLFLNVFDWIKVSMKIHVAKFLRTRNRFCLWIIYWLD